MIRFKFHYLMAVLLVLSACNQRPDPLVDLERGLDSQESSDVDAESSPSDSDASGQSDTGSPDQADVDASDEEESPPPNPSDSDPADQADEGSPDEAEPNPPDEPDAGDTEIEPGLVSEFSFASSVMGQEVVVNVWYPGDYGLEQDPYPVFIWTHGSGGGGFNDFYGALDSQGVRALAVEAVGVFDGAPSLWVDWRDESILASSLLLETVEAVKAGFHVRTDRDGWGIVGFSMGGFGSAHHGFKYPELFGTIVPLAGAFLTFDSTDGMILSTLQRGPVFGDEDWFSTINPFVLLDDAADSLRGRTNILVACGDDDRPSTQMRSAELAERLDDLGLERDYIIVPGAAHSTRSLFADPQVAAWFRDVF